MLRADYNEAPGQEILGAADCREMTLMRSQNAILAAILVTRDTDPAARASLIKVLDNYTAVYRKGCTPPDATGWNNTGNNEASSRERSRPRLRVARAG